MSLPTIRRSHPTISIWRQWSTIRSLGCSPIRSLVVAGVFAMAAIVFAATRLGRDLVAVGSDRKAAIIAGVSVKKLVLGAFTFSGLMAALSGSHVELRACFSLAIGPFRRTGSLGGRRHTRWRVLVRWDGHAIRYRRRSLDADGVARWT